MPASTTYTVNLLLKTRDQTSGVTAKAKQQMSGLAKAAKLAAGAFVALQVAQKGLAFVKFGAEVQRASRSLDSLAKAAGTTGKAITSAIQQASGFTIDRMAAMQAANKAMVMDVAETPEQFERLTKVAVALGRAMGVDATTSISDFTVAAARQSKMIADNLGLTVSAADANERYAAILGKTAGALTDAEKKQAFLNEMLRQGEIKMKALGDSTLDSAAQFEKLEAGLKDTKAGIAEWSVGVLESTGLLDRFAVGAAMLPETLERIGIIAEAAGQGLKAFFQGGDQAAVFHGQLNAAAIAMEDTAASSEILRYAHTRELEALHHVTGMMGSDTIDAHNQYQEALAMSTTANDALLAAQLAEIEATQNATLAHMELSERLADASQAQIAQAALGQLKTLLDEGKISFDEYALAVTDTQLQFGLATMGSIGMADSITELTGGLADGSVKAEDFASSLSNVTGRTNDGISAFENYKRALDAIPREIVIRIREEISRAPTTSRGFTGRGGDAMQAGGYARGGTTLVGEQGPELVSLPPGAHVSNNTQTMYDNRTFNYNVNGSGGAAILADQQRRQRRANFARTM
jgi:hypothetical protein